MANEEVLKEYVIIVHGVGNFHGISTYDETHNKGVDLGKEHKADVKIAEVKDTVLYVDWGEGEE